MSAMQWLGILIEIFNQFHLFRIVIDLQEVKRICNVKFVILYFCKLIANKIYLATCALCVECFVIIQQEIFRF